MYDVFSMNEFFEIVTVNVKKRHYAIKFRVTLYVSKSGSEMLRMI